MILSLFTVMALGVSFAQSAFADTNVIASLWDRNGAMGINVDKSAAPAGKVIFNVVNDSNALVHEMLVVKVKNFTDKLPYEANTARMDESKLQSMGETEEMQPGAFKSVSFDLKPGKYYLVCNMPGHTEDGMFTSFVVY